MVSEGPDALVCDLDGVVYRGELPVDGVPDAISRIQARGVRVLFCSNNSNLSRAGYLKKLGSLGIAARSEDLLTSATVLEEVLSERDRPGERAFCIGGEGLKEAVTNAGIEVVSGEDAGLVCVGFDLSFDYDAMRTATLALLAGASFFATNDDPSFPSSDGLWPGAGAILASVETASGRQAEIVGKPHGTMIRTAERWLAGYERIAIVGDRLETDIAMGEAAGWRTCLVLSGVADADDAAAARVDEVYPSLAAAPWAQ